METEKGSLNSNILDNRYNILSDPSLMMLIFANVLFGAFFLAEGGEVAVLVWTYWSQSVIIGFFNFLRILTQRKFSTKGLSSNGKPVLHTEKARRKTAFFFLFHYGFFHFIYFVFLVSEVATVQIIYILIGALIFLINHGFSFYYNHKIEKNIEKNIGTLLFYPYIRIMPMHIMIVFGLFFLDGSLSVFIFLLLKITADTAMHMLEHSIFNKKPKMLLKKNII